MKLLMFAVRDRATDMFGTPMFLVSTGQAIRSFADEVNRAAADNQLANHAEDFDLYALGEFDTNTAEFTTARPEQIAIGKNVKLNGSGK
jgi:hypothetical protein